MNKFQELKNDQSLSSSGILVFRQKITALWYITPQKCRWQHDQWEVESSLCSDLEIGAEYEFSSKLKRSTDKSEFNKKRLIIQSFRKTHAPSSSVNQIFLILLNSLALRFAELRGRVIEDVGKTVGGVVLAFVFGVTDYISWSTREDLKVAGLQHMIAASGYNVAIVADIERQLLRWFPARYRTLQEALIIIGVWLYTFLAGGSASLWRATLMMSVGGVATRIFRRPSLVSYRLGISAMLMLSIRPSYLSDLSFLLSVTAVAGLVVFGSFIQRGIEHWLGRVLQPILPPSQRFLSQPRAYINETLAATLSAQIFTLPLILHTFGQMSLIAPLANVSILWLAPHLTVIAVAYLWCLQFGIVAMHFVRMLVNVGVRLLLFLLQWWGNWESSLLLLPLLPWSWVWSCWIVAMVVGWWFHHRDCRFALKTR